jgi:excinuclease ABC subunit C
MHEVISRRFRRYLQERQRTGEWEPAEENDGATGGEPGAETGPVAGGPVTGDAHDIATGPDEPAPGGPAAPGAGPDDEEGEVAGGPIDPETGRPRKFAYPPQLVVVDGGQPQVAAAQKALAELGIDDVAVCGLAKRLEEVWLPGEDDPVILPRTSEGLYLLQRVRDEAHRFAITYQRSKRSKSMKAGALDAVPGLGATRRQALLKHFGSLKRLRAATVEEICQVPGIGRRTAETVAAALAAAAPAAPAVNTATGEIIDDSDGASAGATAAPSDHRGHST